MELKGSRHLPAPPDVVWEALSDPAVLQEMLPGCRSARRNPDDRDEFQVEMDVAVGTFTATFTGQVRPTDMDPPLSAKLTGEGRGRPGGSASGWVHVTLTPDATGTHLAWHGEATVGGKLGTIAGDVVAHRARELSDQFFAALSARFRREERTKFVDRIDHAPAGVPILGDEPSERVVEDPAERAAEVIEDVEERIEVAAAKNTLGGPMVWGFLALGVLIAVLLIGYTR
ncbi:MAG: carbon monoxide dehydrogenase subunit G [Bauldia sp.]|nr:carbon monoxide dehydrogenase subunit G [Bauldia sp.]